MDIEKFLKQKNIIKKRELIKNFDIKNRENVVMAFSNLREFHKRCEGINTIGNNIPNKMCKKIITNNMIYNKFLYDYYDINKKVININKNKIREKKLIEIIKKRAEENIISIENTRLREIIKRSNNKLEIVLGKSYPQVIIRNVDNVESLIVSGFDRISYNLLEIDIANLCKTLSCFYTQDIVDRYIENVDTKNLSGEWSTDLIKKLVYFPEKTIKVLINQYNEFNEITFNDKLKNSLKKDGILKNFKEYI